MEKIPDKVIAFIQCSLFSIADLDSLEYDDDGARIEVGREEYVILDDEEADSAAKESIKESLWAFNASFLSSMTDLPEEVFTSLQDKCEGANETFLKLVEQSCGLDEFVEAAVSTDGRGHFLASYDHNETEEGDYFIYRVN